MASLGAAFTSSILPDSVESGDRFILRFLGVAGGGKISETGVGCTGGAIAPGCESDRPGGFGGAKRDMLELAAE